MYCCGVEICVASGGGGLRALPGRLLSAVLHAQVRLLQHALAHAHRPALLGAALLRVQAHRAQVLRNVHHHDDRDKQSGAGRRRHRLREARARHTQDDHDVPRQVLHRRLRARDVPQVARLRLQEVLHRLLVLARLRHRHGMLAIIATLRSIRLQQQLQY